MQSAKADRSLWPKGIIIFFVCLAAFDAVVIGLAIKSNRGLIEAHPYKRGLEHDKRIAESNLLNSLGISVNVELKRMSTQAASVSFIVPQDSPPIESLTVRALRLADPSLDRQATLAQDKPGLYSGRLPITASGLWRLEFDFSVNGMPGTYQTDITLSDL